MTSYFGIIALSGVYMNNSLSLVEEGRIRVTQQTKEL